MAEEWRESRQDERIERLEDDLREANKKIWALERRPGEWILKAEEAIIWLLVAAMWVLTIVDIATKN